MLQLCKQKSPSVAILDTWKYLRHSVRASTHNRPLGGCQHLPQNRTDLPCPGGSTWPSYSLKVLQSLAENTKTKTKVNSLHHTFDPHKLVTIILTCLDLVTVSFTEVCRYSAREVKEYEANFPPITNMMYCPCCLYKLFLSLTGIRVSGICLGKAKEI